jgi:hypothetical protein
VGDVDEANSRFRVKAGKTAAARRWVALPEAVMEAIAETCPREDRTPERRVFPGFTPDVAKNVMARAPRSRFCRRRRIIDHAVLCTLSSPLAEASVLPSGLNATPSTALSCRSGFAELCTCWRPRASRLRPVHSGNQRRRRPRACSHPG